ncbi:MAG: hypothetical protein MZV65_02095 [Chromatiales bacterium]|nr:hypothetical protein [Chromatiales bacterium]
MRIPADTKEFAINMSQHAPLGRRRCSATSTSAWPARTGPRGKDFNMRWVASHGGRRAPHPHARRHLPVPLGHSASPTSPASCA